MQFVGMVTFAMKFPAGEDPLGRLPLTSKFVQSKSDRPAAFFTVSEGATAAKLPSALGLTTFQVVAAIAGTWAPTTSTEARANIEAVRLPI
ncbi:hypothetical protein GCM10010439_27750 [Actinocorallia aurantiaca]|uniref:Uncharacterized protein n=1 Tax=Actinocorallia aurantiaca TaxID=46204 RepID=A0ABN3U8H9_9ACTN